MERRWRSISQSELARRTGVKQHYISQWELGAEMHPELAQRLWEVVLEKDHKDRGKRKLYSVATMPDVVAR